jgi:HAE1 family hydrophobic/amphiphilic exporter-1
MVIGRRGTQPIRLSDVATIDDTVEEQRTLAVIDGEPAVAIDITKQTQANTVGVVDAVRAAVTEMQPTLPPGTEIQVVRDTSTFIRESVADVQNTLVIGGILTVLIVFLFLNSWRSTVITGLTLPISVIASFIIMHFLGMTLNTLTLMALSLAIGLLIDDAIVVRENIGTSGEDRLQAARGTASRAACWRRRCPSSRYSCGGQKDMAFFQHPGGGGRSLVSFIDPMLSSRHDPDTAKATAIARALDAFNNWFERMADGYKRVIGWALDHRKSVVAVAFAAFVGGIGVFSLLQAEFQPPMDQGEFLIKFKSAPGASFTETRGREVLGRRSSICAHLRIDRGGDADTIRRVVADPGRARIRPDFIARVASSVPAVPRCRRTRRSRRRWVASRGRHARARRQKQALLARQAS